MLCAYYGYACRTPKMDCDFFFIGMYIVNAVEWLGGATICRQSIIIHILSPSPFYAWYEYLLYY